MKYRTSSLILGVSRVKSPTWGSVDQNAYRDGTSTSSRMVSDKSHLIQKSTNTDKLTP